MKTRDTLPLTVKKLLFRPSKKASQADFLPRRGFPKPKIRFLSDMSLIFFCGSLWVTTGQNFVWIAFIALSERATVSESLFKKGDVSVLLVF